jgi:Site-specific recombinases, DNA invertase Pin homologs
MGYIRVSTKEQNPDRQIDLLKNENCDKIFCDKISGIKEDRPQLNNMLDQLRAGDIIVVTELSRFGRSTKDLISMIEKIHLIGANIKSLKESFLDTSTSSGKMIFTILSAVSQFERDLIAQRTVEGLESARARGRKGGRPLLPKEKINKAIKMYESKQFSLREISELTDVSTSSLFNYLKKQK